MIDQLGGRRQKKETNDKIEIGLVYVENRNILNLTQGLDLTKTLHQIIQNYAQPSLPFS